MKLKICFTIVFVLVLSISLSISLVFTQLEEWPWDYCIVSGYGTELSESAVFPNVVSFLGANPPSGSEISNTIYVENFDTGENYTKTINAGQQVQINYQDLTPINYTAVPAAETGHYIIYYEGPVQGVGLNNVLIPEFSPILIVPLFMIATLLATMVYRRKRQS